jgi:hypothetical protein
LMPLDFFPLGVHKGLSVPNEGVKYGWTALPNNCSLWDCHTTDAAERVAWGGVSAGHVSGHQRRTFGCLVRGATTWKRSATLSEVSTFLSISI